MVGQPSVLNPELGCPLVGWLVGSKRIGAGAFSACQKLKLFEKSGKILLIPKTAVEYIQTQIFKIQIQTMFNFSTEAASSASDRCLMMDERKWASFCTHSASY